MATWGGGMERDGPGGARRALGRLLEAVLASRGEANAVFDILAVLQVRLAAVVVARRGLGPDAGGLPRGGVQDVPGGLLPSRVAPSGRAPPGGPRAGCGASRVPARTRRGRADKAG